LLSAIALATRCRNRSVTGPEAAPSQQVWVNVFRDATARDRPADAVPPHLDRLTNADRSRHRDPAEVGSGVGFRSSEHAQPIRAPLEQLPHA
jgi:hypothetical protein